MHVGRVGDSGAYIGRPEGRGGGAKASELCPVAIPRTVVGQGRVWEQVIQRQSPAFADVQRWGARDSST